MDSAIRYIDEKEVSKITGLALPTLRNHRHLRIGIPYIKATNRSIRYSFKDVINYMESRKIVPEDNMYAA